MFVSSPQKRKIISPGYGRSVKVKRGPVALGRNPTSDLSRKTSRTEPLNGKSEPSVIISTECYDPVNIKPSES